MSKLLAGCKVIRQSCVDDSGYRGTVCPNWTRTDLWGSCRVTGHSTRTSECNNADGHFYRLDQPINTILTEYWLQ